MSNIFLQTIEHLRHYEEVILYGNLLYVSEQDQNAATVYLSKQYDEEKISLPFQPPPFDGAAALWGAQTIYVACQLMLYRENKASDIETLLPIYKNEITPAAIFSADLTLRFLPSLIRHLNLIDPDDPLINNLENHLITWHYSGINYPLPIEKLEMKNIVHNNCLFQSYIDRVIESKRIPLANHPELQEGIHASLGIYHHEFWNELTLES
jgi:hypothetical protein